jgi:adenosylcobinamide-phosphate synthase
LPFGYRVGLAAIALKPAFALRRLLEAGREIRLALASADLDEARRLTGWHLVSRDTRSLSAGQVASAAVESLSENLTDSLAAPLLYFVLLGLPGAWFYRFVNTADAMIGYRTPRYEYLGKFAARLDDLLNRLPARLAALCLAAAAGLCRLDVKNAWRVMASQHGRTSSPNAGWTMAAAAGALGVRLEKSACYSLNEGKAWPEGEDIRRAQRLVAAAAGLSILLLGGLSLVLFR